MDQVSANVACQTFVPQEGHSRIKSESNQNQELLFTHLRHILTLILLYDGTFRPGKVGALRMINRLLFRQGFPGDLEKTERILRQ